MLGGYRLGLTVDEGCVLGGYRLGLTVEVGCVLGGYRLGLTVEKWVSRIFRKKNICLIYLITSICLCGTSLLTLINCCVPVLNFGPLVARYLPENGVSGI